MKKIHKNQILLNDNGSYMQQQIEIDLENEVVELKINETSQKMSFANLTKFCIMVCKACSEANEELQKKVINNLNKS